MPPSLASITMVTVYNGFVVLLLVVFIVLCLLRRGGVAFLALVAAAFCACFSNLDHIAKFEASVDGLQVTLNAANNTIEQLQRMAGLLGQAIIDSDRFSGSLDGVPAEVQTADRKAVAQILQDVQAGPDILQGITRAEHNADTETLMESVYTSAMQALPAGGPFGQSAFAVKYVAACDTVFKMDEPLPPAAFDALFRQFNIAAQRALTALKAYRLFYDNPEQTNP